MAAVVEVALRVTVRDASGIAQNYELPATRFLSAVGDLPVVEEVLCAGSSFTAFTIPAGAQACLIRTGAAPSLSLKADNASTNIPITPAAGVLGMDQFLSLGPSPELGIHNGGADVTIPVIWF